MAVTAETLIVAGVYSAREGADRASAELRAAGFEKREISILPPMVDAGGTWARRFGSRLVAISGQSNVLGIAVGLMAALRPSGTLQRPPTRYGVHLAGGATLVTVFCHSEDRARRAGVILQDTGAKDIELPLPPVLPVNPSQSVVPASAAQSSSSSGISVPIAPGSRPLTPLLSAQSPVPFTRIHFSEIEPAISWLLADTRRRLEVLVAGSEDRTFHNTLRALDELTEPLDYAMTIVRHLESVATDPELRSAFNSIQPEVSAFYGGIPLHEGLWRAIRAYAATAEAATLAGEQRRYLDKTIATFRRYGADLDPAGKKRLEDIDLEIAQLTTKFAENVLDSTNAFELAIYDEPQLAGLPPGAVETARQRAVRKGQTGWRFTLQAQDYFSVLTYLEDGSLRRQVYEAYGTRAVSGAWDNRPLISRILELRYEKAALLGYANFADLVLEDRMAHSSDQALSFLEDLKSKTLRRFREENRELVEFRRSLEGPSAQELEPWDVAYYAEKQRAAVGNYDEEELRPYFSLEQVLKGVFDLLNRLYGIHITERSEVPAWDADVRYYVVQDRDSSVLGAFYADWFPRENKRGGAWMDTLITGGPSAMYFRTHLGVICTNLTPPADGRPALLTMREVETVFNMAGYIAHLLLSRVEIRALAGNSVAWDFVSLPSQIMENWCWERQMLDVFAHHRETGGPIPEDLFRKMLRARTFRAANAQMRQLGFGVVDLMLHMHYSPARDGDPVEYTRKILQEFSPTPLPPGHALIAAFTHLFGSPLGYSAGYYSYKWAEMLDADAFTRFREAGLFNSDVGRQFRENILSKGDSEDPAELFRRFMGRDPAPQALLERLNLA